MMKVLFAVILFLAIKDSKGKYYHSRTRVESENFDDIKIEEVPVNTETQINSWSSWSSWSTWSSWNSFSKFESVVKGVSRESVKTFGGNSDGKNCKFPFVFNGITYNRCTGNGRKDGLKWCATTESYDKDRKYGFCNLKSISGEITTSKGKCVFPFIYNKEVYYGCTKDGMKDGSAWCSLDWDYNGNKRWAICPSAKTFAGNSDSAECSTIYKFQGRTYSGCTTDGRNDNLSWCATTENYDKDLKWGFCIEHDYPKNLLAENRFFCAFPFIYGDKAYYNCTTNGRKDNRKWCSLTHNYNQGKSWGFCPQKGING